MKSAIMPFTLEYLSAMLAAALERGYKFVAFDEQSTAPQRCLLRHDCDNDLVAARAVAECEREREVRATFFIMLRANMYNALSLSASRNIEAILNAGHHLGLHFDESLVPAEADVAESVEFECGILERYFGVRPAVVSFHQPGPRILRNEVKIRRINTYNPEDLKGTSYVSDSSGVLRVDMIRMFQTGHFPALHLNLHPEWWGTEPGSVCDRWKQMLLNGIRERQDELWERENSFPQQFFVELEPIGEYRELPERMLYQTYDIP